MFQYLDKIEQGAPTSGGEFNTFGDYIGVVFNYALGIGVAMSVIGVLLAGIKYVTARNDPKQVEQARDALFWSIFAMLLVLGAYGLTLIIMGTLQGGSTGDVVLPGNQNVRSPKIIDSRVISY